MKIKEAVVLRFVQICNERGIAYNTLAVSAGVTPSTIYSMLKPERKEITVNVVKKLCDGLDITITEFFNDKLFLEIEQEIE